MIRKIILVLLLLIPVNLKASDLLEVLKLALENNYSYKANIEAYNANVAYKNMANSYLLPQVDLKGSYNWNYGETTFHNTDQNLVTSYDYPTGSITLSISQPIYSKEAFSTYSKAKLVANQARVQLEIQKNNIFIKTVELYFNVLAAQDDLEFSRSNKKYLEDQINEVTKRVNVGEARVMDIEEVKAKYEAAIASEIIYENNLVVAIQTMENWVGQKITKFLPVVDDFDGVFDLTDPVDKWQDVATKSNLDILNSNLAVQIAEGDVIIARSGYHPTIALVASDTYTKSKNIMPQGNIKYDSNAITVGISLTMNLYSGGVTRHTVKQAMSNQKQVEYQLRALEQEVLNLITSYYANIEGGSRQLTALKQAVTSSEKVLEAAVHSYNVGLKTNSDVLNATDNYFNARRNYAKAKYNYLLSILTLKGAVSIIEVSDVEEINRFLKNQ